MRPLRPKILAALVAALAAVAFAAAFAAAVPPPAAAAAPGDLVWMQTWYPKSAFDFKVYPAMDLARGPSGDIWLASQAKNSSSDNPYVRRIALARYSPSGVKRWGFVLPSPNDDRTYQGLAVDRDGNAVVGAWHVNDSGKQFWSIAKLSPSGKRVWVRTRSFSPDLNSQSGDLAGVAVDSNRNIYVVGTIARAATGDDVALSRYSPTGVLKWTRYIDGYQGTKDRGAAIAVDAKNRVFVCGTVGGFFSGTDIMLARYTTAGGQVWKKTWDDVGSDDQAIGLAVSAAGVAVSGSAKDSTFSRSKGVVLKAGVAMGDAEQPAESVTAVTGYDFTWNSVAINATGDVAAGGSAQGGGPGRAGTLVWPAAGAPTASFYAPGETAACYDVALTPTGTLVGAGIDIIGGNTELQVMSDPLSGPGWRATVGLPGSERGMSVAVTAGGIYVAGEAGNVIALWKFQP